MRPPSPVLVSEPRYEEPSTSKVRRSSLRLRGRATILLGCTSLFVAKGKLGLVLLTQLATTRRLAWLAGGSDSATANFSRLPSRCDLEGEAEEADRTLTRLPSFLRRRRRRSPLITFATKTPLGFHPSAPLPHALAREVPEGPRR